MGYTHIASTDLGYPILNLDNFSVTSLSISSQNFSFRTVINSTPRLTRIKGRTSCWLSGRRIWWRPYRKKSQKVGSQGPSTSTGRYSRWKKQGSNRKWLYLGPFGKWWGEVQGSFATWHRIFWLFKWQEPLRSFVHILPAGSRLSPRIVLTVTLQRMAFYKFPPTANLNSSLCQVSPRSLP